MGARPPLETSIVAAGRYGWPVAKRFAACVVVALAIAGCSGGSGRSNGASGAASAKACTLIATLDETTANVAKLDVSDPDAYKQGLDAAVTKYADTVRELKNEVPNNLGPDLDRLEAAVHQYRFDDAAAAKQSLDSYAADKCGRVAAPTTVATPSTSTPTTAATTTTTLTTG
jgi:hypothetical protein